MLTIKRLGNGPSYRLMEGNDTVYVGSKEECENRLKEIDKESKSKSDVVFRVDVTDPNYLSLLALPFSDEACPTIAEGPFGGFHMVNWSENLKKLIVSPVPLSVEMAERRLAFHRSLGEMPK